MFSIYLRTHLNPLYPVEKGKLSLKTHRTDGPQSYRSSQCGVMPSFQVLPVTVTSTPQPATGLDITDKHRKTLKSWEKQISQEPEDVWDDMAMGLLWALQVPWLPLWFPRHPAQNYAQTQAKKIHKESILSFPEQ